MKAEIHCKKWMELKFILYDGGWGDTGAFLFWQCNKCGEIIKTRINDAKRREDDD